MIKFEEGKITMVGTGVELLADLSSIEAAVYESMVSKGASPEVANRWLTRCLFIAVGAAEQEAGHDRD